jgi:hypothetical protein
MNAEYTNSIEETEDTSTVDNATPTIETSDELPIRVRLSPIGYEIIRAGPKAYSLLIDGRAVATFVTKKDAQTVEALVRFLTRYSGRKYMRAALEAVLTEPEPAEATSEEAGSDPEET